MGNLGDDKIGGIGKILGKVLRATKNKRRFSATVRIDSGVLRVARGGSGAKAPPHAARPEDVSVINLT